MGVYIYKVGTKAIGTFQGAPVYPSKYGYKPFHSSYHAGDNARMAFRSGVAKSEAYWQGQEHVRTHCVLYGGRVIQIAATGSFYDDHLEHRHYVGYADEVTLTDRATFRVWANRPDDTWESRLAR